MFSGSESEAGDVQTLSINEHYAKAFEYRKEREELAKLKEKYGSDYSDSGASDADDSEEDTEEDTDGEELTPAVDAAILRTLARIRKKDPAIYEGSTRVFEEEHLQTQDKAPVTKPRTTEKSKPLTIREAALVSTLAEADLHSRSPTPEPRPPTHIEEQALLRSETRAAFHGAVDSEASGDDNDLLIPRSRTRDEIELEEEEYKMFLEREVGEDLRNLVTLDTNDVAGALDDAGVGEKTTEKGKKKRKKERKDCPETEKHTKERAKKFTENADQDFLMNYIFNRGWIDRSNRRAPTYNEIVESTSIQPKQRSQAGLDGTKSLERKSIDEQEKGHATLSDEESFDDLADAFETSYNFRFEEPGGALVASFPRNLQSARRESTTRKDARARKRQRQETEKQEILESRRQEIRRERALVEAAVAEEDPDNEDVSTIGKDAINKNRSKKQQRKEDLARLKALKTKELRRKLEIVSAEGGLGDIGDEALAYIDLDADWDPSKHDAQMAELYGGDDVEDEDTKKPTWDDDINIDDIVASTNIKSKAKPKKKKEEKRNEKVYEDVEADADEMDADLDTGAGWDDLDNDDREWEGTEKERKRKVDAYMDEVVNRLGFSGITAHMPTRFHYTLTTPENYSLTSAEMLLATDAELNSYVGLKKIAPYRIEKGGKPKKNWDPKRLERLKEFRANLHSRVGSRFEGSWSFHAGTTVQHRDIEGETERKKRKGKKERAKLRATLGENGVEMDEMKDEGGPKPSPGGDKSRKRRHASASSFSQASLVRDKESLDVDDGEQKKRRRRRHKKEPGESVAAMG